MITLRYDPLYHMYMGSDGFMYDLAEAQSMIISSKAKIPAHGPLAASRKSCP